MSRADPTQSPRRDLWIPAGFVLFFVALAGLQLWFVLLANRTFTGLVTDPKTPAAHHDTAMAPDWSARLAFTPTGTLAGTLDLTLTGANGAPLAPDRVVATAERMTRFPQLLPIPLRPDGPGRFKAPIRLPLGGAWTVRILLTEQGRESERLETLEVEP